MAIQVQRESVFLGKLNKKVFLNFFSIADEEWIKERWTQEQIDQSLFTGELKVFLTIFWRFLDDEGKQLMKDFKVVDWDESGEKKEIVFQEIGDKLKHVIRPEEIKPIYDAIWKSRNLSQPDAKENEKKSPTADAP
jgi:hypothetical protein